MKILKVLRGLLLKKSPKQGSGQCPEVFSPAPTKYGGFVKKDREVLTEGTRFDIIK